ncbi:MAG TPA: tetratricopeptide repeat protein [Thermoanaerobaculia bacterium]|nr:tetratricopeptide repeat protein [Thermoanaerobaculia bacterium]
MRSTAKLGFPALVALAALSGCLTFEPPPGSTISAASWNASLARRGVAPAEAPNPMALTPEMTLAASGLAGAGTEGERLERLRQALLDGKTFSFEYEKYSTFTSTEAFEARRGNCVSFTNLFIALGRSLGSRLQAALVSVRGKSELRGDLVVTHEHMVAVHSVRGGPTVWVYDFFQGAEEPSGPLVLLDDLEVAAVLASNAGVAHLGRGENAEAYREFGLAVKLGPRLGVLWANLGLAAWRMGDTPAALVAYRRGLDARVGSPTLHQNLAALHVKEGRPAEARAALASIDTARASPYAFLVRGDLEMTGGRPREAITNYRKAAAIDPKLVEPWLAIARAELMRGRSSAARKAAEKALKRDPESAEARRLLEAIR